MRKRSERDAEKRDNKMKRKEKKSYSWAEGILTTLTLISGTALFDIIMLLCLLKSAEIIDALMGTHIMAWIEATAKSHPTLTMICLIGFYIFSILGIMYKAGKKIAELE